MNNPNVSYTIVYECMGPDVHEFYEGTDSFEFLEDYAVYDADYCPKCKTDYDELNSVKAVRIEINH